MNNKHSYIKLVGHVLLSRLTGIMLFTLALIILNGCANNAIFEATRRGDLEQVKSIVAENPKIVNSGNGGTESPLCIAVESDQKDVAEFLIAHGADVNYNVINIGAPLHIAALHGYKDMAVLLLANGADVNLHTGTYTYTYNNGQVKRIGDMTPLHMAITHGHMDVADLLRQHGGVDAGYDNN